MNKGDSIVLLTTLKEQLRELAVQYHVNENDINLIQDTIQSLENKTEQLEFNSRLTKRESYYKFLIENQSEGFCIIDLKQNIILSNTAADALFDVTEGLINHNLNEFIDQNNLNDILRETGTLGKNEKTIHEVALISDNYVTNRLISVVATNYILNDSIVGTMFVFRDITEQKRIEKNLIESELSYIGLFNNISIVIFIINEQGILLNANEGVETLYGYKRSEVIGKSFHYFIEDIDIEFVDKELKSVFTTGATQMFELWCKRQNGAIFPKEVVINKGVYYGHDVLIVTERDISKRKEIEANLVSSERKYKNLFDNNPLPMWIYCVENLKFIEVNNAAVEHYGYSVNEFLSMTLVDIQPENTSFNFVNQIKDIHEQQTNSGIWQHVKKDGSLIDVEIISHAILVDNKPARLVLANDITEKKKAESFIANERILLRTLIDNIPDAVYVKDNEARKLIVNRADLENIDMQSEKDVIGKTDFDLFPKEIAQKFYEDDMLVIQQAKPVINHIEYLCSNNGHEKWLSTSKYPLFNDKNQVVGIVGIGRDITLQKLAEKKILQLSKGIEQNPAAIVITNLKGEIEYVNSKFLDVSGYTQDELIGKNPRILKSGFTPDSEYETLWNTITSGNEWHGDFLNRKKGGELFWESALISPIRDENGNIINYIGIKEDITHKKEIELELRKLSVGIEQSPTSIVITDTDGKIEYVNRKFLDVSGFVFNELKSKKLRIFYDYPYLVNTEHEFWNNAANGNEWHAEHLNKRKNNDHYWESVLIAPIRDNNNIISNYIVISEDITQRKMMENELIAAKEKAEEGDRLKTAFLNNMSHEIRTPLNAIVGFTSLLCDSDLPPDRQSAFIAIVQRSSDQLLSIISDIMSISTIEAGQLRAFTKDVNINNLLDTIYNQFIIRVKKEIKFELIKELPDNQSVIITDETKLNQIISNLLVNALKFTNQGQITFGYTVGDNVLIFSVSDTGIGIDKDVHQRIFERFRQADYSTGQKYGGNGLGLSIAKSYVELLGGQIWLESEVGKGSTFSFTLPYTVVN